MLLQEEFTRCMMKIIQSEYNTGWKGLYSKGNHGKKVHFSSLYLSSLAIWTLWETISKALMKPSYTAALSISKRPQKDSLLDLTRDSREADLLN